MTTAPKTKQKTYKTSDVGSFLPDETLPTGYTLKFKHHPTKGYGRYRYGYSSDRSKITINTGDNCIKAEKLAVNMSRPQVEEFLAWLNGNAVYHTTDIRWYAPKSVRITSGGNQTVWPEVDKAAVSSTIYRRLTDEQRANLATIEENRKVRVAEEKRKAAEARRKRDTKARADKKRAEQDAQERAALAQVGDLAAALKVLKKHGLRVVTVAEKEK